VNFSYDTQISGLIVDFVYQRHDYKLKMHYKAFGSRTPPGYAGEAQSTLPETPSWILQSRPQRGIAREREGRQQITINYWRK